MICCKIAFIFYLLFIYLLLLKYNFHKNYYLGGLLSQNTNCYNVDIPMKQKIYIYTKRMPFLFYIPIFYFLKIFEIVIKFLYLD